MSGVGRRSRRSANWNCIGTGDRFCSCIGTNGGLIQVADNVGPIYASSGKLTLGEANDLYRNGNGTPVIVDASKYDFSAVDPDGFNAKGRELYTFPKFKDGLPSEDFLVDGTVTLQMNPGGQSFRGLPDTYDFDMHSGLSQTPRNIETLDAHALAGPGTLYPIIFQGNIPINH